jgi:hypothetical protein
LVKVRTLLRMVGALVVANGLAAAIVWACGPDFSPLPTVTVLEPGDRAAFDRGEVGIVRPRFRRATLALAYRVFNAQPPLKVNDIGARAPAGDPQSAWRAIRERFADQASDGARPERKRRMIDYVTPRNCLDDAYGNAVRTFADRQSRYGAGSPQLREWVRAQIAVFANCDEEPLLVPEPAAASADALTKADRAYQSAAAYFYAMQYEEAARRFQAIGEDSSSPWRPYGHYLAARATLRTATMADEASPVRRAALTKAEVELEAVVADPIAAPVHGSARGLLKFVRVRLRPFDQLLEISARIASSPDGMLQSELADFTYLLDRQIGDTTDFEYAHLTQIDRLRGSGDLVDWILAMQGRGPAARDRAIARFKETGSPHWLIAALSHVDGPHEAADALLLAATAVPASSPSYPTVAFHRVRVLIGLGRVDAARQALARLPDAAGPGVSAETINLYRGERLMVATTLEEFLKAAPRTSLDVTNGYASTLKPLVTFDEDAGVALAERFPLERLIEAALSPALPARLRTRVAVAAFTRAILFDRHDQARRIAPALKVLAKALTTDVDRYMRETTAGARRRAAVLLILRTPGMTTDIRGLDDFYSAQFVEPRRSIESFVTTWWCGPAVTAVKRQQGEAASELIHALYPSHIVPYPSFISEAEQRAAKTELASLDAIGHATTYLATAALDWARERPTDPEAAEALSRIVRGWRYACRDSGDTELSRRSFEVLHRQFPNSEWAKRTPFWYR